MQVSLKLEADEFILRGGMMEKSFVCQGLSVVSGKKFVKMGKDYALGDILYHW